jgi:hypothetical protein
MKRMFFRIKQRLKHGGINLEGIEVPFVIEPNGTKTAFTRMWVFGPAVPVFRGKSSVPEMEMKIHLIKSLLIDCIITLVRLKLGLYKKAKAA